LPWISRPLRHAKGRSRGQTIVEFALIAPVLILLLLIAIDFGRVFLGWISLNNAARVGANYAALHPHDWDSGTGPAEYDTLMADNLGAINCTPNPDPAANPVFGPTKEPGELVRVDLGCDFNVLTPVVGAVLGGTVTITSNSSFPISYGCLADCPTGPPAPPPPPPASNCRKVPAVVDLSVAGARAAWVAAGFLASNFNPPAGADDTRTVASFTISEPPNTEGCVPPQYLFASSITVTLAPLQTPKPTPTCLYVPNVRGVTVLDARNAWTNAGFVGQFLPTGNDTRVVIDQATLPASDPGDCMEPDTTMTVSHGPPPPAPPPAPCKVPSFVNTSSAAATTTWVGAGFAAGNISFKPKNQTFTIQSQSLVGGTYIGCGSSIEVRKNP
jgi:TadE-like protein